MPRCSRSRSRSRSRSVRQLYLFGVGCSLLGTFLIHLFLYRIYAVSLAVRFFDCLCINLQLFTGLLPYGACWTNKSILALGAVLVAAAAGLLAMETRYRSDKRNACHGAADVAPRCC